MAHLTPLQSDAAIFFEAIFNNASMGIVAANRNGAIQKINPFALELFGYSQGELLGKPIEILIPKRYHLKHKEYHAAYIDNKRNRPMGNGKDLFAVKKNGHEFPVDVSLGTYNTGSASSIIAFISDISVRKAAERELEALNEKLELTVQSRTAALTTALAKLELLLEKEKDLSEIKSKFISMASHEFRTPLSTILSSAFLIEKYTEANDQPKRERHIQRIISSVTMLTDILNDFLSVGKIEEGKLQVRLSTFDLKNMVTSIVEEFKINCKQHQKISCTFEGDPIVELDASIFKHIFLNLISNACKFTPDFGNIDIYVSSSKALITLVVKDNGIGISTEDQLHLTERFFRGVNATNIQGTGLGLHIVATYAEMLGGTLHYTSEPGKGSEFQVNFNINKPFYEKNSDY